MKSAKNPMVVCSGKIKELNVRLSPSKKTDVSVSEYGIVIFFACLHHANATAALVIHST